MTPDKSFLDNPFPSLCDRGLLHELFEVRFVISDFIDERVGDLNF